MSYSCATILVGVASPVSEILILSKTAKFPFRPMDYSPWSSKNLIDRSMGQKGNLVVFESSNISKTGEVTPTKIGVLACYINTYLHDFFEPIPID